MRLPELQQLVSPFPPEVFTRQMDGKEAILLRPVLSTPLDLPGLDALVSDRSLRWPTITLRDGDDELSPGGLSRSVRWGGQGEVSVADPAALQAGLKRGCCVCLPDLHRHHGATAALVRALERTFHMRGRSEAVLAPADARSWSPKPLLRTHRYVLQCVGRRAVTVTQTGLPDASFDQVPGTALYVPPGASTRFELEEDSLWIDIELTPITIARLAAAELRAAAGRDDMHGLLPVGLWSDGTDLAAAWQRKVDSILEEVDHEAVLEAEVDRFVQTRLPLLRGQLQAPVQSVQDATILRRRPGLMYRVVRTDRGVELRFHGKTIGLPPGSQELLAVVAEEPSWRAGDLLLPDAHRLEFIRHLLREGFVEVVRG
jgi:hypothetical protein